MKRLSLNKITCNIARAACLCIILGAVTGCYLIDTMQPTLGPVRTPTSLINVDMLPTLPTLPPETVVETPVPQSNIYYEGESSIFAHVTPEPIPNEPAKKAVLVGAIVEIVPGGTVSQYVVRTNSGEDYTVVCDDYCFYVNDRKDLISNQDFQVGTNVIAYGATDDDEAGVIQADAIAAKVTSSAELSAHPESLSLPSPLTYTEYPLVSPPKPSPLTLTGVDGSLAENLEKRNNTMYSGRTRYSYGAYGEVYSAYLEYGDEGNRDPAHPTRGNMTIYSNDYEFMNFWYPHVENPYFDNSGIVNFGGDWFLTIRMTVDINPDPVVSELLFSDRTVMSQLNFDKAYGYLRSFGFSILNYNLFYFYQRETGYGFALNRVDYPLGFDEIVFGMAGDYQDLNPYYADNLVQFIARRGTQWYLVEIEAPQNPWY